MDRNADGHPAAGRLIMKVSEEKPHVGEQDATLRWKGGVSADGLRGASLALTPMHPTPTSQRHRGSHASSRRP